MIIETGSQLSLFLKFGIITFFILNLTSYISVCPVAIRSIKFFVHQSIGWFSIEFHYWIVKILLLLFLWLVCAVVGLLQNI